MALLDTLKSGMPHVLSQALEIPGLTFSTWQEWAEALGKISVAYLNGQKDMQAIRGYITQERMGMFTNFTNTNGQWQTPFAGQSNSPRYVPPTPNSSSNIGNQIQQPQQQQQPPPATPNPFAVAPQTPAQTLMQMRQELATLTAAAPQSQTPQRGLPRYGAPQFGSPRTPSPTARRWRDGTNVQPYNTNIINIGPFMELAEGWTSYRGEIARWLKKWGPNTRPHETRPCPLAPGTVAPGSRECWTCGHARHFPADCSHQPVHVLEQG